MPNIPFTITTPDNALVNFKDDSLPGSSHGQEMAGVIKVSDLVIKLKNDVEKTHRHVRVLGELSSFKPWRSGHCYFDIKDEHTVLPAVMFKPHASRLPFTPKDGQQIIFTGRISIYPNNAKLQMCVEAMEPIGQGALALAFEQLKERLLQKGLFDAAHKKPIKSFNENIGLITSPQGAVLRDMVRILKSRMPKANILFTPTKVQGSNAGLEISHAIKFLDNLACDVIIVARGGGSLEDLWPFNEEIVAHAIFAAKTPIISAVGHETDFSISDFVADLRAATPTHAATLVVPEYKDLIAEIAALKTKLTLYQKAHIKDAQLKLLESKKHLKDPRLLLLKHWQHLDEQGKLLTTIMNRTLKQAQETLKAHTTTLVHKAPTRLLRQKKEALFSAQTKLAHLNPSYKIALLKKDLVKHRTTLDNQIDKLQKTHRALLEEHITKLEALSPLKVLIRGYSVIQTKTGHIANQKADFFIGQDLTITVEDGVIRAQVTEV